MPVHSMREAQCRDCREVALHNSASARQAVPWPRCTNEWLGFPGWLPRERVPLAIALLSLNEIRLSPEFLVGIYGIYNVAFPHPRRPAAVALGGLQRGPVQGRPRKTAAQETARTRRRRNGWMSALQRATTRRGSQDVRTYASATPPGTSPAPVLRVV